MVKAVIHHGRHTVAASVLALPDGVLSQTCYSIKSHLKARLRTWGSLKVLHHLLTVLLLEQGFCPISGSHLSCNSLLELFFKFPFEVCDFKLHPLLVCLHGSINALYLSLLSLDLLFVFPLHYLEFLLGLITEFSDLSKFTLG